MKSYPNNSYSPTKKNDIGVILAPLGPNIRCGTSLYHSTITLRIDYEKTIFLFLLTLLLLELADRDI